MSIKNEENRVRFPFDAVRFVPAQGRSSKGSRRNLFAEVINVEFLWFNQRKVVRYWVGDIWVIWRKVRLKVRRVSNPTA